MPPVCRNMSDQPERALTIRDPWLWAIVNSTKRIENRSWSTSYRGRIYLHSAGHLAPMHERKECLEKLAATGPTMALEVRHRDPKSFAFKPSHLVATADLIDCVQLSSSHLGHWGIAGLWHWILIEVKELAKPIPMKGQLGLWRVKHGN